MRRIDRQPGEPPADLSQLLFSVDGAELEERAIAVLHRIGPGRVEEREVLQLAQVQGLHLQNHRGQVRPLNLLGMV